MTSAFVAKRAVSFFFIINPFKSINVDLTEHYDRVCFGDKNCFKKTFEASSSGGSSEGKKVAASKDHGPEFQDRFYREAIRQRSVTMGFDDVRMLRLIAFALIKKDYGLEDEFCRAVGVAHYYNEFVRKLRLNSD